MRTTMQPRRDGGPPEAAREQGAFFGRRKGKTLRVHHAELPRVARCRTCGSTWPRRRPRVLATLFPAPVSRRSISRSATAAASIWPAAPARAPMSASSAARPSSTAPPSMLAQAERTSSTISACGTTTPRPCVDWLPEGLASPAPISSIPIPGRSGATASAASCGSDMLPRLARVLKPGAELRFATDIDDYAAYALARIARSGRFRVDGGRPGGLADAHGTAGSRRATRSRRCARGGCPAT